MIAIYRPEFTHRDLHTVLAALEMYENQTDGLEAQREIYHATKAVAESVKRAGNLYQGPTIPIRRVRG